MSKEGEDGVEEGKGDSILAEREDRQGGGRREIREIRSGRCYKGSRGKGPGEATIMETI